VIDWLQRGFLGLDVDIPGHSTRFDDLYDREYDTEISKNGFM
jgi:hypothetical protein